MILRQKHYITLLHKINKDLTTTNGSGQSKAFCFYSMRLVSQQKPVL